MKNDGWLYCNSNSRVKQSKWLLNNFKSYLWRKADLEAGQPFKVVRGAFENFQMLQRRPTGECCVRKERVLWSSRSGPLPHSRTGPLVSLGFTSSPRGSEAGLGSKEGRPSVKPILEVVAVITRSQSLWASVNVPRTRAPMGPQWCHRTLALGEKLHIRDKEILYSENRLQVSPPDTFLNSFSEQGHSPSLQQDHPTPPRKWADTSSASWPSWVGTAQKGGLLFLPCPVMRHVFSSVPLWLLRPWVSSPLSCYSL